MVKDGIFLSNRYEVLSKIGAGGMADVYKGRDCMLNRYVAIKVLKKEYREDENFVRKFRSEAQAAAAEFGIPFYYEDWRGGYQRGVDISLELGLYRQQYCGCVFSERDRYEVVKKPKGEPPKGEFVVVSKHIKMVNNTK